MTGAQEGAHALVFVYAVFGDEAAALAAARDATQARLAACANMLGPCRSVYVWNGEQQEAAEWPVLFKTAPACRDTLMARIAAAHAYDVPAIAAWQADAVAPSYAQWVHRGVDIR